MGTLLTTGLSTPAQKKRQGMSISAQEAKIARERMGKVGQQLQGVKSKMNSVKKTIHQKKVEEQNYSAQIKELGSRIAKSKSRIANVQGKLHELAEERVQLLSRLQETQIRLMRRRSLLTQRLRENYTRGQTTYVQVLLESRSMNEMLSRNHYVRLIVKSDTELIESVKSDIALMKEDRRRLEQQQREQESLAQEYESQKQEYLVSQAEEQRLLKGAQAQRHEAEEALDELEEAAQEMNNRIRHLSAVLRRRRELERQMALAARRAALQRNNGSKKPILKRQDALENPEADTLPVWTGGFRRPVSGSITSGFGTRFHPILKRRKRHTGVDFGAPHGTPIHAAGSGVVIMAGYYKGYGNTVIIDHGKNTTTLYGHCSSLLVSEGQSVKVGQVIARVGSTGMSTGPHLHWEVRRNGVPVNPL
jgi:murein DD-endopeptidase MepM/ murein hydrolase activator NlpD